MNLYRLTQSENTGYDTYDSAIVAAESSDEARLIRPDDSPDFNPENTYGAWASKPEYVDVDLIGVAVPGTKKGVILASFNAG